VPPVQVNVVNEQAPQQQGDGTATHAPSYLARLVSPENLPTDGLAVIGIVGIGVAISTLKSINKQAMETARAAKATEDGVRIANQAVLGLGEGIRIAGNEVQVPIENYGRVHARITKASIEVIVKRTPDGQLLYRRDTEKVLDELVAPAGKQTDFRLIISLPRTPRDKESFVIGITVAYDTGFHTDAFLRVTRVYMSEGETSRWLTAWGIAEIEFPESDAENENQAN
jgi:hypothetical protein